MAARPSSGGGSACFSSPAVGVVPEGGGGVSQELFVDGNLGLHFIEPVEVAAGVAGLGAAGDVFLEGVNEHCFARWRDGAVCMDDGAGAATGGHVEHESGLVEKGADPAGILVLEIEFPCETGKGLLGPRDIGFRSPFSLLDDLMGGGGVTGLSCGLGEGEE